MNPVKSSLRYPAVTLILTALAVGVGVNALLTMPRTEDPTITIRQGLVLAAYPGATSEQVEQQVTKKIEEHIFKFPEVRKEKTYSTSRPGWVMIIVELEDHVKDSQSFWAKLRHEMNETAAMELPKGVRGPLVNSDFGDTVAMLIAVHGKRYGYRELHNYLERMKDELRTVRDVGKLASYGEQDEEIRVTSSLDRISQYFADPLRIIQALQQRNVILSSGDVDVNSNKVPLRTTGLFTTEEQIGNVMVDLSRTGQPVYIKDFATVERRYEDPTFVVRYDGEPSVLLSVEMQHGRNIVQLGKQIEEVMDRLRGILPPDLQMDLVANQPGAVEERMTSLGHEFLLAIVAVILVTIILLPLRVAVIAAVAIPVTITASLGALNAFGIQLHQVSIAALIVVLGIVVDDAIVIADNYVDCLDRGVSRADAAWQCVSEVVVPVLAATLTIIASFLPMLVLQGSVGEFIQALPITVATALGVSFIVAVMLTPLLCRFFIRKGLHDHSGEAPGKPGRRGMLDLLQTAYNTGIVYFMRHKVVAMVLGVAAVAAGVGLYAIVQQQFFPSAERNQFVIDVWMPQGTRIEATDQVMKRIESGLRTQKDVAHFASFLGQSAPRFYYNVNPQLPDSSYGQFIVNTKSVESTPKLVANLRATLARMAPEALVVVKELQQGMVMEAPVEVRITGYDLATVKRLGRQVEGLVRNVPFAEMVHSDYYNDTYFVDVNVDAEISNRLGLTNATVSQTLAGAFTGAPVSTFWEGDRAIRLVLRLDPAHRDSFEDVRNAYLTSPITHSSVPLRAVAKLAPEWQSSRIVRRNGVRTLTVRAFPTHGHYASQIIQAVGPQLDKLTLPEGYHIIYGGERENSEETMPGMIAALAISLVAIFLVLLLQFRNLSDPLIVMSSIPLTLFGAVLGLVLTGYPFGFTAFIGLISLCGIVVRNAIILVDYIHERQREGRTLEEAATEAGERRLRPIFLTTMAAAVGVTPMIVSGSSLWGPLASVIAVGLISSMFFTLLVVPVLYVLVKSRAARGSAPAVLALLAVLLVAAPHASAETRKLTLDEAVQLALKNNTALKIAASRVKESAQRTVTARSDYFPHVSNSTSLMAVSDRQLVTIPAGSLGNVPGLGPFPMNSIGLDQGSTTVLLANTTMAQPITQLLKIHQGVNVATAGEGISKAELEKARDQVVLGVHQLYYGLLSASKQASALEFQVTAASETLKEADDAVRTGAALEVASLGARASLLKQRQSLLTAKNQVADFTVEMNNVLGLPLETTLELADLPAKSAEPLSREEYLKTALDRNPELRVARQTEVKARSALVAARLEYVPDLGAFAQHTYQSGVPFVMHNFGTFGLRLNWNLFDWGKRKGVIGERQELVSQARNNIRRISDQISVDVEKAYRKLERTQSMMDVAREALALRREAERLSRNQLRAGVTSSAKVAEAVAATRGAESDELQARLAHELALAEIANIAGIR